MKEGTRIKVAKFQFANWHRARDPELAAPAKMDFHAHGRSNINEESPRNKPTLARVAFLERPDVSKFPAKKFAPSFWWDFQTPGESPIVIESDHPDYLTISLIPFEGDALPAIKKAEILIKKLKAGSVSFTRLAKELREKIQCPK